MLMSESGGVQRPADWCRSIELIGSPEVLGSINLHQSAGLCAQPETAQDYQTLFFLTHTQKKKKVVWLYMRDYNYLNIKLVSYIFKK